MDYFNHCPLKLTEIGEIMNSYLLQVNSNEAFKMILDRFRKDSI